MLTELIINLIIIAVCLFLLLSPVALLLIIIRWAIKRKRNKPSEIHRDYMDKGPYGTGWTWNEETKLWDPPKNIKSDLHIEENIGKGTTHEVREATSAEMKAESEPQQKEETQRTKTNTSEVQDYTYHYQGTEIPKEYVGKRQWQPHKKQEETKQKYQSTEKHDSVKKPIPTEKTAEYQNAYQAAEVFTVNERNNYITLKRAADRKGYIICPKMRLADIVTPRNDKQYMSRFGKIKSKHLDFVIYDNNMRHIITVIELDDNSHNRTDRKERDEFVDFILNDCGIRIIHTRHITEDILNNL